ncbi:MAG: phage holin family protein [Deltaproteobacteria bacterium]|nr:phage holin family protein [Deltaproteobacteria bacterium]MBI3295308.1 phage holin family protein [Deltaproteobacteria bacterium]
MVPSHQKVGETVESLVTDLELLLHQELGLVRTQIRRDLLVLRRSALALVVGYTFFAGAILLLAQSLTLFIESITKAPPWASYAITTTLFVAMGQLCVKRAFRRKETL